MVPSVVRPMTETVRTSLRPAQFFGLLASRGTGFFAGVPDSLLKDFCAYVSDNAAPGQHVVAANEGTAVAAAVGHHLATGRIACVYLQNSGLGNAVNPLLSLCSPAVYAVPLLMLIGWRGEPGRKDEPQHMLQGRLTPGLLSEMHVAHEVLPDYAEGATEVVQQAYRYMEAEKAPFALLVKRQVFDRYDLKQEFCPFVDGPERMMLREEVVEQIIGTFPSHFLVSTTGFASRELFELRERRGETHGHDFLTVGSMGHSSSIALGVALSSPRAQVLCIDGDGSVIMHMGALVTCGRAKLENFKHILLNNAVHDSVGGQPTGAEAVDWPAIARACGYTAFSGTSRAEVGGQLRALREAKGPAFLEIRTVPGARADLGRPTTAPQDNKAMFMERLQRVPRK